MTQKSLKYNIVINSIKTVSGLFFPLILFSYVSRVLSVEGIGQIDYVKNVVSFFIIFASLGITAYGTREGAKVRTNKNSLSKFVRELLIINAITTFITYVVFFFLLYFVKEFESYEDLFLIYSLCIGFTALGLDWLYNALEDFQYITVRYVIFQLLALLLTFVFVNSKDDVYIYTLILVLSTVGSNVLNFIHSRKFVSYHIEGRINITKHFTPILILFSNSIIGNVYLMLDTVMLGWMTGAYSVGLYSAANKINRICVGLITSVFIVLLPRVSYYLKSNEIDKYRDLLAKSANYIFLLSLPLGVLLCFLSSDLLLILSGKEFLPGTLCSQIISVIVVLIPLSSMNSNQVLIPLGKEKLLLYSTFIGALINIVLNYLLIPIYAEKGAAIASLAAELLVAFITTYNASKIISYNSIFRNIWHYFVAVFCMSLSILPLMLLTSGLFRAVLVSIIGLFIYILCLLYFRDKYLNDLLINIYSKFK